MLNQGPRTGLDARGASSIYIGPDVQNKFTLILLNKNPKIYESVLDKEVNIGQKASDFPMVSQAAFGN